MKKNNNSNAWFFILMSILFLILVYNIVVMIAVGREIKMSEKTPTQLEISEAINKLSYSGLNANKTKQEYRKQCEDLVGCHIYFYEEENIKSGYNGLTTMNIRLVKIRPNLSNIEYIITITHELIHLKNLIGQENWTEFMTFKTLYESSDDTLHKVGCHLGLLILLKAYPKEYDCSPDIVEYLKGGVV